MTATRTVLALRAAAWIAARRLLPPAATAVAFFAFLTLFALLYMSLFNTSLSEARRQTEKEIRKAAWRIAIGLYVQAHANAARGGPWSYRAPAWVAPPRKALAFAFTNPDHFVTHVDPLDNEIHAVATLTVGGSSGPAKSMPSGPFYSISSWYRPYPLLSGGGRDGIRFRYEDDPLAGSRFPYELAARGVFAVRDMYWSPPVGTSRQARSFSVSAPQDVFLAECAEHIEGHLRIHVDREYEKWSSIARLSTFLYFAATFGLGEIGPASQAVGLMLVCQIVVSTAFLSVVVPQLGAVLSSRRRIV